MLFNLVISSIIFLYLQGTLVENKELRIFKRDEQSPLGVIWHHSDLSLEPAIPEEYQKYEFHVCYEFDETKDENFFVACPISSESNKLTLVNIDPKENEYPNFKCEHKFWRTLENLKKECANESKAQLFGVGYYINIQTTKGDEMDKFLDIYKICRIEGETHFTIHELAPIREKNYITVNQSVYRFVPSLDMPTHTLQITTEEAMNSMPLFIKKPKIFASDESENSKSEEADSTSKSHIYLDHLNKVDKAIRGFVQKFGYRTKIYTGLRTTTEEIKTCKYIFKVLQYVENGDQPVGFAVITRFDSSNECTNVCNDISERIKDFHVHALNSVKSYARGFEPLTYACRVDENVVDKFGLNKFIHSAMEIPSFLKKKSENVDIVNRPNSPLGVIWDNKRFKFATLTKYENEYFSYTYDPKDEEFIAVCPLEFKKNTLFMLDYPPNGIYKKGCKNEFEPTTKYLGKTCHEKSEALLYGVGYNIVVPNSVNSKIKFFNVYRICSKDEITYFTIHDVDPISITDRITEEPDDKSVYRFVPLLDMHNNALQAITSTIKEPKNNTTAPKHTMNYSYLKKVDEAIRDYIKKHAYKTKIYSGLFETNEEKKTCKHIFKVLQFQTESNNENGGKPLGFAVITRFNSPEDCSKICKDNETKFSIPENKEGTLRSLWNTFHHKPFAYACKVDQDLITAFKLNNFIDKEMENPSSSQNDNTGVTSSADSGNNEGGANGGRDY